MQETPSLSVEPLRDILEYSPEEGELRWKVTVGPRAVAGQVVRGRPDKDGYRLICIGGKRYSAHRLAWGLSHGQWPEGVIDHLNGLKDDNRLVNLRDATLQVNSQNRRRAHRTNRSGFQGVAAYGPSRYRATIYVDGKHVSLGYFSDAAVAHQAYINAKRARHPGCTV